MSKLERTYWPYIICAYLSLLAFGFIDNIRGPFYPEITESLGLTASKASLFYGVTSFMGFVTSHLTPWLLRYFSTLWLMRIALFFMSTAFFWFGFVTSFTSLIIGSFIFGVGFGISAVIQNYAVQVGAHPKDRQKLFSGLHANFALSSILAPLMASFITSYSWNQVFFVFGFLPFAVLIGSFFARDIEGNDDSNKKLKLKGKSFAHALFFAILFSLYLWGELSVATRFVLYNKSALGFSHQDANMLLVYFFVGLLVGRLLLTKYQPPISALNLLLICLVLSSSAYLLGLFYSPYLISLSGLFIAPCFPLYMEFLSIRFKELSGNAMALSMGISSLGVVIMHSVLGGLTDIFGIQKALIVGPAALMILAVGLWLHNLIFKEADLV